jgi:hypothetical protein
VSFRGSSDYLKRRPGKGSRKNGVRTENGVRSPGQAGLAEDALDDGAEAKRLARHWPGREWIVC